MRRTRPTDRTTWLGVLAGILSAWVAIIAPLTHSHAHESESHACHAAETHGHSHAHFDLDHDHERDTPAPSQDDCPLCVLLAVLPNTWVMPGEAPSLAPISPVSFVTPVSRLWTASLEPTLRRPRGPPML